MNEMISIFVTRISSAKEKMKVMDIAGRLGYSLKIIDMNSPEYAIFDKGYGELYIVKDIFFNLIGDFCPTLEGECIQLVSLDKIEKVLSDE